MKRSDNDSVKLALNIRHAVFIPVPFYSGCFILSYIPSAFQNISLNFIKVSHGSWYVGPLVSNDHMIEKNFPIVNPVSFLSLSHKREISFCFDNLTRSKTCLLHMLHNWYSHCYILKEFC